MPERTIRTASAGERLAALRLRRYRLLRQSNLGPAWVLVRDTSDPWLRRSPQSSNSSS